MEINDDLIKQWEPKINKMLQNTFVIGLDRDDIAQELRIAIVKAAQGYNEDKGVLFHTYLHTAMTNTLRTLITKAQHTIQPTSLDMEYLDVDDDKKVSTKILQALLQEEEGLEEAEIEELLQSYNLTPSERSFVTLRLEGLTMEEISEDLGESAYKIRTAVRNKLKDMFYEEATGIDSE